MKAILVFTMLFMISYLCGYDIEYTVNYDGSGDYTNISAAVDAVQPGQHARITVLGPGEYIGAANRDIEWNGSVKNITLLGINDPVIDLENQGRAFTISNGTTDDIISSFTIRNGNSFSYYPVSERHGASIRLIGGSPRIINNTIEDSSALLESNGGAIFISQGDNAYISGNTFMANTGEYGGAVYIEDSINLTISENSFNNNTFNNRAGGIYARLSDNLEITLNSFYGNNEALYLHGCQAVKVSNNTFENNHTSRCGAAITFEPWSPDHNYSGEVRNNAFESNYVYPYSHGGLLMYHPSVVLFHNGHSEMNVPNSIEFSYNILSDNEGSDREYISAVCFYNRGSGFDSSFANNTFSSNAWFPSIIQDRATPGIVNLKLVNNLLYNNFQSNFDDALFDGDFELEYCAIYGYDTMNTVNTQVTIGEGCLIDVDPEVDENLKPLWDEHTFSPLIDGGHPESPPDPDGTRADIGAVRAITHDYHPTDVTVHHLLRFRWRSFPVIDREIYENGEDALFILSSIETQTDYFIIQNKRWINHNHQLFLNEWEIPDGGTEPDWTTVDILTIDSRKGYKLHSPDDLIIPTTGFKMPGNAQIELYQGINWVGYFIEETLPIHTALADIWDHIIAVYSEDWAYYAGPEPPETANMIYGKMYKLVVDRSLIFSYNTNGTPVIPNERAMTEGFLYDETPMYTVVNIDEIGDPEALEIGMFLDNECIGATAIDDDFVQILAFPQNNSLEGEVHFELYYGARRGNRVIRDFTVYDPETSGSRSVALDLRPYRFNHIRLGETSPARSELTSTHYPNPFNPETVIYYSLSQDSEVELTVYNIKGQRVTRLVKSEQPAGAHRVVWDGRDERGNPVSSGVYFYRLSAGELTEQRKMMLLK